MQQSTIRMIRMSRQQQGDMFSNTIFITFNNQHRHCNTTNTIQNIYNWKQCNWQHANTTERCSIWYILCNNQPQCLSHIYKELSVKISITEWQWTVYILKPPTVIANKSWFEHWGGSLHTQQDVYDIIYYTGVIICDAMHCFFFKLIQTEVQLATILRQIQNELDSMYTRDGTYTQRYKEELCYYQMMTSACKLM